MQDKFSDINSKKSKNKSKHKNTQNQEMKFYN